MKQQLSTDKKYLPISKRLLVLLREINPYLADIQANQQMLRSEFLQKSLSINKTYVGNLENFHRSLMIIEDKNHAEVEKSQKIKLQKSHQINQNLKSEFEKIELKITQANQLAKENLAKADMNYKRELSGIQRIMNTVRKTYQQNTLAIENEKIEANEAIATSFENKLKQLDEQLTKLDLVHQAKVTETLENGQKANSANDETYLIIKNTYSQLSIQLNKKINEIKKKHQLELGVIEKEYQTNIKPVDKAIELFKLEYQAIQRKALQSYSEKLNSLNVIFDIQKQAYENKKERIIYESNEAITLFNSKFSAYRESTQKEKLITSRKMRDEMKSFHNVVDQDKHNRILTRFLNAFDNDLNKQIIRTNKDILEKQRDQQQRLFAHDQKHLKEINDWRLRKVVYEYEKKQEFAKIDLNFHHNLTSSEKQLKLLQSHYNYQKEILLLNHNKDLLPLEFQLAIAAAVQERELNLLGNDAHLSIAYYKHQESLLDFELKKDRASVELEKEISKTLFSADTQVLNISIQLELEKEKIKRDFVLNEQELRIELNQALLNKSTQLIQFELNNELYIIDSDKELMMIENKHALDIIKAEALKEEHKREFVINEAHYKNQQRKSNEKAARFLKTYRIELEFNQEQTEDFMKIMRMYYGLVLNLKKQLIALYHLPSHPEVFKGTINNLLLLSKDLLNSLISILEQFQALDQEFYIKKIEDLTGYKYMLKHEDTMNYYNQEINKITQKRAFIENEIKKFEDTFFIKQSELERNQVSINQLSKDSQDIKGNHKQLNNHEKELKRIRKELVSIENEIDARHQEFVPIDKEVARLTEKQKNVESKLEQTKHQEASLFYRYLNHNQEIYHTCAKDVKTHFDAMQAFYQALQNEVYVSDAFLTSEEKKLDKSFFTYEKQLVNIHQAFLDLMLKYYHQNEKEQLKMIRGFKKSMSALLISLNLNNNNHIRGSILALKKQSNEKDKQLHIQKDKIKKKLELERLAFLKKLAIDQLVLKQIESKITENSIKQIQELKLLNENQISIAAQYNSDFQQKQTILEDAHKKVMVQVENGILNADKNYHGLEESVTTKNQVLLTRYQISHEKNIESLKQKTFHYEQLISKATSIDDERIRQHQVTLKRMNVRREDELRNILSHHKRYISMTRKTQNRVLAKENRLLKKSHHFKMRMLHLN
ncbi:MAG: hypothetical protein ABII85_05775 [Bacillota bacterium]